MTRAMCCSGVALIQIVQHCASSVVGRGFGDQAAAGGEHEAAVAFEHAVERALFVAPVTGLAGQIEDLIELHAGDGGDLARDFEKRAVEGGGEFAAERAFAGAAQADQRDARRALRRAARAEAPVQQGRGLGELGGVELEQAPLDRGEFERARAALAHQLGERQAERRRDLAQPRDRNIAAAGFELDEKTLRQLRVARQQFARHAALQPLRLDARAQRAEISRLPPRARRRRFFPRHRSVRRPTSYRFDPHYELYCLNAI